MKNYKAVIAAVATGLACTAVTSQATFTPMSPGIGLTSIPNTLPPPISNGDFNTPNAVDLLNSKTSNYSFGGNAGMLTTDVYKFNSADLPPLPINGGYVFIFTLTISSGNVNTLKVGGFSGPVSVNNVVGTASESVSANYDTLGGITFAWSGPQTGTLKVVVDTSSTAWTGGLSTIKSGDLSGTASSLAAVPEPSPVVAGALLLLPFGIGAIRSLRKDRTA